MGLALRAEDVHTLESRTEGWIVGLQLAALSMRGRADAHEFVAAFGGSHHYVLEYLTEEVLRRQPAPVRQFLLHTSILDRLSGPLCDAMLGDWESSISILPFGSSAGGMLCDRGDPRNELAGSQEMLGYLATNNLFLAPIDDEHYWYRYHRLFADLLGNHLRQELAPEDVFELHRRASRWYEDNGLVDQAVAHALQVRDFERTAQLIEHSVLTKTTDVEATKHMDWIQVLPPEIVRARPALCVVQAWAMFFTGRLDDIEPWLQAAEKHFGSSERDVGQSDVSMMGNVAALRAFVADRRGDESTAIHHAQAADKLLPQDDVVARSIIPYILGRAYRLEGDLDKAIQACAEMVRIGEAAGNVLTVAMGMCERALLHKIQGQLGRAAALYQKALQRANERGDQSLPLVSIVDVGLSDLLRERNDLEEARQRAQRIVDDLDRTQLWGMPTDLVLAYTTLARVRQAQGDLDDALAVLERAESAKQRYSVFPEFGSVVDACRIRLWLARGSLADAVRWADAREGQSAGRALLVREREQIAVARVRIVQGLAGGDGARLEEALDLLSALAASADDGGRQGRLIEILVLQSLIVYAGGNVDRALTVLERCLSLAEPEGYVRVFVDEGEPMVSLLDKAVRRGIAVEYASRLLEAFGGPTGREGAATDMLSPGGLVEPLTRREHQVLQLICEGYSNQEIAEVLVVTLSTVKKHGSNIYGKIGVSSRTQAIVRARELGLITSMR